MQNSGMSAVFASKNLFHNPALIFCNSIPANPTFPGHRSSEYHQSLTLSLPCSE